jgi:hypothetical protein
MTVQQKDFSIAGTSFLPGAWPLIERLRSNVMLILKREPTNKYDANAVAVYFGARKLGFLPKGLAQEMAPLLDNNVDYRVYKSPRPLPGVLRLKWEDGEPEPAPEAA